MTQQDERRVVEAVRRQVHVGGQWRDAAGGGRFDVLDPSTGEVLAQVADGGAEDALAALDAAAGEQAEWAATAPRERGEVLRRAFELMTARADDLGLLMTLEMGKSVAESVAEVRYAAEFLRWFAEEAVRVDGRFSLAPAGDSRLLVMHQPVGVCVLITPWNVPLAMGTRKIGPAVAAGCTMVMKPAQETPLSMLALAAILAEAGLPPGVLNVVPTSDAAAFSKPLLTDPRVRKVSFTGSTAVGRLLLEQAAGQVLRTSMELGGNAPFLVFDDADVDAAVEGAIQAKMRNVGEACTAANRFHVQAGVAEEFTDRLAARIASMRVGRGTEDGVEVGPLVNEGQRATVTELVDDAMQKGATVRCGGAALDRPGFFFAPTVLAQVPADARILKEEVFGPVAPVTTFGTEEEGIAQANDTELGLVSYAYTRDLARGLRVAEALQAGMVGLNRGLVSNPGAPFGGVKQSGIGREGGREGIHEYLEVKYVAMPR